MEYHNTKRPSSQMETTLEEASQLRKLLKDLFASQSLAVLATQDDGQSYGSLVAFAATGDLRHLLFATTRTTRKYANLLRNPKVAMVIDNRTNQPTDFHTAIAVTATGAVEEVHDPERIRLLRRYLSKHPYLKEFATSLTCALLKMEVDTYFVVSKFQNVMELHINK